LFSTYKIAQDRKTLWISGNKIKKKFLAGNISNKPVPTYPTVKEYKNNK